MTDFGVGFDYDPDADFVNHRNSNVIPGAYDHPGTIHVDAQGHVVHIESGSVGSGYIEGLGLRWESNTRAGLGAGAAYLRTPGRILEVGDVTEDVPAGANLVLYAYLYETNGVGRLEVGDTPPDLPYFGTARTKQDDDSRRYLGMLRKDGNGNLAQFECEVRGGGSVDYYYVNYNNAGLPPAYQNSSWPTNNTLHSIGPSAAEAQHRLVSPACRTAVFKVDRPQSGATGTISFGFPLVNGAPPTPVNQGDHFYVSGRLSPAQEIYVRSGSGGNWAGAVFLQGYVERR